METPSSHSADQRPVWVVPSHDCFRRCWVPPWEHLCFVACKALSNFSLCNDNFVFARKLAKLALTSRPFLAEPRTWTRKQEQEISFCAQICPYSEEPASFAWCRWRLYKFQKRNPWSVSLTVKLYAWMHKYAASIRTAKFSLGSVFGHLKWYCA